MYVAVAGARGRRRRRRLGDSIPPQSSLWTGVTQNSVNPFVFVPEDVAYLTQPDNPNTPQGTNWGWLTNWDWLSNAAYGTQTAGEIQNEASEGAAAIQQAAGGNEALALAQTAGLNQDLNALATAQGGIAPSIANLTSGVTNALDPSGVLFWALLGLGAVAALAIFENS